jgi:hypothetical protein
LIPRTDHADPIEANETIPMSLAADFSPSPIAAMHFEHSNHGKGFAMNAAQLFEQARVSFRSVVKLLPHWAQDLV